MNDPAYQVYVYFDILSTILCTSWNGTWLVVHLNEIWLAHFDFECAKYYKQVVYQAQQKCRTAPIVGC